MSFILTMMGVAGTTLSRMLSLLAEQSPARLFLLFQALLAVLFVILTFVSAFYFARKYSTTLAIKIQQVSPEQVWDHLLDVTKNPISSKLCVQTTYLPGYHLDHDPSQQPPETKQQQQNNNNNNNDNWKEDIGSNEIMLCKTVEMEKPKRLIREMWLESVYLKSQWTFVLTKRLEKDTSTTNGTTTTTTTTTTTILRIYVTVESLWGSFMTPFLRLVLTYTNGLDRVIKDYFEQLCKDMAVPLEMADEWE